MSSTKFALWLKTCPTLVFVTLSIALLSFGFQQTVGDPSLFILVQGTSLVYLLIYVDDMVLSGNDTLLMTQISETRFKIKDLGSLSYFLGIQVSRTTGGLFMNQEKYIADILK